MTTLAEEKTSEGVQYLTPISAPELTSDDIFRLHDIAETRYTGTQVKDILLDYAKGQLEFLRFGKALVVVQWLQHPAGLEMNVWGAAGEKTARNVERLFRELREYAREKGARWMGAGFIDERFAKRVENTLKPKKAFTYFISEIGEA